MNNIDKENKELETEFDILNKKPEIIPVEQESKPQFFSLLDGINIKNFSTPVYTTNVPVNPGIEGEIVFVKTAGTSYLYTYIDAGWKKVALT